MANEPFWQADVQRFSSTQSTPRVVIPPLVTHTRKALSAGHTKLKKAIEENVGIDYGRAKTYTVGTWLEVWMENYAKVKLKTSQGFLKNHIKPQIGGIPLADLTSLDLQRFYKHLLDGGRVKIETGSAFVGIK